MWGNQHYPPAPSGPSLGLIDRTPFLLEAYEPDAGAAESAAARLEHAAGDLTREGTPVVYRRTIRVTVDETSFHLLDAENESVVEAVARRAGIQPIRVVAAEERAASSR